MKAHFAWKQLKVDYSKNNWKEENRGQGFVGLLAGYISVKKSIENFNSVGTGVHKVGKSSYILKKVGLSTFKDIIKICI